MTLEQGLIDLGRRRARLGSADAVLREVLGEDHLARAVAVVAAYDAGPGAVERAVICCGCFRTRQLAYDGAYCQDCGDYLCPTCIDDVTPADDVRCHRCARAWETYAREHRLGEA